MYNQNFLAKKTIYLMLSSFLSFIYIYVYINIPNEYLRDRSNYILYAKDTDYFLTRYDGFDVFFNEPLFLYLNKFLSNYFDYDNIPIIFVFFNTFIMVFLLLKYSKNLTFFVLGLIFIVVFPYIFQAQVIALRQSLATSLFLISFFYLKDHRKVLVTLAFCSFIHSVFFLITFFYFINFFIFNKFSLNKKIILNFFLMLLISFLFFILLKFFGLRQADEYGENTANALKVGGGAFLIMCLLFVGLYRQKNKLASDLYTFVIIGLVFFIVGYFINPITGRLFNTFAPFLMILLVSRDTKINFFLLVFLCIVYGLLFFNGEYNSVFLIQYNSIFDILQKIDWKI